MDSGKNSQISYSLVRNKDYNEFFNIDPLNGTIWLNKIDIILLNKLLIFENSSLSVLIKAKDNGFPEMSSTAEVYFQGEQFWYDKNELKNNEVSIYYEVVNVSFFKKKTSPFKTVKD